MLAQQEIYRPGKTAVHMCTECYHFLFQRENPRCVLCSEDISYKLGAQRSNWREIYNHICDGRLCAPTWAMIHAAVLGDLSKAMQKGLIIQKVQPLQNPGQSRVHKTSLGIQNLKGPIPSQVFPDVTQGMFDLRGKRFTQGNQNYEQQHPSGPSSPAHQGPRMPLKGEIRAEVVRPVQQEDSHQPRALPQKGQGAIQFKDYIYNSKYERYTRARPANDTKKRSGISGLSILRKLKGF